MKDIDRVLSSLQRLKPMQSVVLCFNEQTGINGLMLLHKLINENPKIQIPFIEKTLMEAVLSSGKWGATKNRIYHIDGLVYTEEKLLRNILKYIDTASAENRGVEGMLSGRKKRREEVVRQLSNRIFTPDFIKEIKEWELHPKTYLGELEDGTPSMQIDLLMNDDIFMSLTLDGFSGRVIIDGILGEIYVAPGQFQQIIITAIESAVESITA